MITREKIIEVLGRLQSVEQKLADPAVLSNPKLYRQYVHDHAALKRLEAASACYFRMLEELAENRTLAATNTDDPELVEMAEAECQRIESELPDAERAVVRDLLPPEPEDQRNAVLEIRAGTGGEEAALFAGVLFRMYSRYCDEKGWKISIVDASPTELGGYKEIVFIISGTGSYGTFKFESGGHRVQRVPETESQGRIHTSAATVVVFPELEEDDDIELPEKELRIDIFCASGHGGQGVNTTYSAVRITHLPSGITAQCQDERSQHKNKDKAMAVLKARIRNLRQQEEAAKLGQTRLDLRGSGDRSQRIRTYNFPQNRLTDHRINLTLYSLDRIVEGTMNPLLDALHDYDQAQRLLAELG